MTGTTARTALVGMVVTALVAVDALGAKAETIGDPVGVVAVGTTSADNPSALVAVANGGCANGGVVAVGTNTCSHAGNSAAAVAIGGGSAEGFIAIATHGAAMSDCIELFICFVRGVAVSGTGPAGGGAEEFLSVSGTGNAAATQVAISGTGTATTTAHGSVAASGTGTADASGLAAIAVSGLNYADTGGDGATVSGGEEIDRLNLCVYTPTCNERLDDLLGAWYAANALVGMGTPFPASIPLCGGGELQESSQMTTTSAVCAMDHYQRDCPEIIDGNGAWQILEWDYWDINGCTIPLRYGEHYGPHQGWGFEHIQAERTDWTWGDFTRRLTRSALGTGYRQWIDRGLIGSCYNYRTSGGRKRTWHVLVDYKYGKGIVTAFHRRDHNNCHF